MNVKLSLVIEIASSEIRQNAVATPPNDAGRPLLNARLASRLFVLAERLAAWSGVSGWF